MRSGPVVPAVPIPAPGPTLPRVAPVAEASGTDDAERTVDDGEVVDELPADLDVTALDDTYTLPNNDRRRIPAAMYLVIGAGCAAVWGLWRDDSALVNDGMLASGVLLVAFAAYGFVAGRTLRVDETDALVAATARVGFPVGHASAQMVWRGWWSRPVWRLLLYSAENPPTRRGLVLVDGIDGEVVEWFTEDNPETWVDPSP